MRRLWFPVIVVGWLFVLVGCGSLYRAIDGFVSDPDAHAHADAMLVGTSGLLALAGGVLLLLRKPGARWLCAGWMAAHILISLHHNLGEVFAHTLMLVALVLVLWNPRARP